MSEKTAELNLSSQSSITITIREDGEEKELFTTIDHESTADSVIDVLQQLGYSTTVR